MGRHEVAHDRHVRRIGEVFDIDQHPVEVGVDYDTVSITVGGMEARLTQGQCEEFAQFFVSACWQAAAQQAEILTHDEGTSYCTNIPGKCPVHDA